LTSVDYRKAKLAVKLLLREVVEEGGVEDEVVLETLSSI